MHTNELLDPPILSPTRRLFARNDSVTVVDVVSSFALHRSTSVVFFLGREGCNHAGGRAPRRPIPRANAAFPTGFFFFFLPQLFNCVAIRNRLFSGHTVVPHMFLQANKRARATDASAATTVDTRAAAPDIASTFLALAKYWTASTGTVRPEQSMPPVLVSVPISRALTASFSSTSLAWQKWLACAGVRAKSKIPSKYAAPLASTSLTQGAMTRQKACPSA
mmetsp:Transcript_46104/g.62607  ORF Transcript_46104/g.62607 Transcript_46104/m.62607 type:complete len:221 (+) Transcript_46104:202-864(+)